MYGLFFAAADCLKVLSFMYKLETFYSCDLLINSLYRIRRKVKGVEVWAACRSAAAWLLFFFFFFKYVTLMFVQTLHFVALQSGMLEESPVMCIIRTPPASFLPS